MNKNKRKNHKKNYQKYFPIIIFISILFMSVGYATINSLTLEVDGNLASQEQTNVFITEAKYYSGVNSSQNNSSISQITGSMMKNDITLSSNSGDTNSSITYAITVYNSNSYPCLLDEIIYEEVYSSNPNITYELSADMTIGTKIPAKETKTFHITFKYKNGVTPSTSNNTQTSFINFIFIREPYILASYSSPGSYSYKIPETGTYRVQLWGASGYSKSTTDGRGAYVQGDIELTVNTQLYIYVGGKGNKLSSAYLDTNDGGGYNGGGNASNSGHAADKRYGGGGATDIRLVNGDWNNFDSLKSRIIVAAGGGSYGEGTAEGGNAGGLIGYGDTHTMSGSGGTQTAGGEFKVSSLFSPYGQAGGFGYGGMGGSYASGGGSGYYGGGGGSREYTDGGGGGGSSFISGHNGCDAISSSSTSTNIIHTAQPIHYSGYKFTNTIMIDGAGYSWTNVKGNEEIGVPNYTETGVLTENYRDGYAIIKFVPTQ